MAKYIKIYTCSTAWDVDFKYKQEIKVYANKKLAKNSLKCINKKEILSCDLYEITVDISNIRKVVNSGTRQAKKAGSRRSKR